ncbi:MAG: hypothetical protein LBL13_03335 [Bacteroidales bacterium]|jgi:hypothetical protein|nr:hypothetical protein [Bacteroidales bacterium]
MGNKIEQTGGTGNSASIYGDAITTTNQQNCDNSNTHKKKKRSKKKRLFFIAPIGNKDSEERKNTDWILDDILKPIFRNFEITCAHREYGSVITNNILNHLDEDELVVADLSGLNPNVMYELAFRHSVGKHAVLIAQEGTVLPFDVIPVRTIFYKQDVHEIKKLKEEIKNTVKNVLDNPVVDNPITTYQAMYRKFDDIISTKKEEYKTPNSKPLYKKHPSFFNIIYNIQGKRTKFK